jgi:predicted dehydrogenase
MRGIIDSVRSWGAEYLDKSQTADLETYHASTPDVVIIATPDFKHVEIAESWLKRKSPPRQIFIEKPLAASLSEARRLLGSISPYDDRILAFDHYRARLLPSRHQMDALLNFLGHGVSRFTFYFLEDHSGADPTYADAANINRDGPIENEQRVRTLDQGVLLDGMPHMIALLAHVGRVETLRISRIRAGQYIGVDGDPDKRTEISKETFAATEFVCADFNGNRILGAAYVGKGVRGVRTLGAEFDHNVKLLEIEGLNGHKARFDLRSSGSGRASLIDETDKVQLEFALYRAPYEVFLSKVADGTYLAENIGLHVEVGKRILEVLEDMRYPIVGGGGLPPYPSGMRNVRDSLYLEDVLDRLPVLYGSHSSS